jgi:hypothetical protein
MRAETAALRVIAGWMLGTAKNSPRMRGIVDVAERWEAYWQRLEEIKRLMASAQEEADSFREVLESKFGDAKAAAQAGKPSAGLA